MRQHPLVATLLLLGLVPLFVLAPGVIRAGAGEAEEPEETREEDSEGGEVSGDVVVTDETEESAGEGSPYRWLATFANGDAVRCRLLGLDGESMRFESEFAAGTELEVPIARVMQLELRAHSDEPAAVTKAIEAAPYRLDLRSGSTLPARLTAFDDEGVTAEVPLLGSLRLAWSELRAVRRRSVDPFAFAERDTGRALVVTGSGDRLRGTVQPEADGTTVSVRSEAIKARVAFSEISALLLADPPVRDEGDGAEGAGDEAGAANEEAESTEEAGPAAGAAEAEEGGEPTRVRIELVGRLEILAEDVASDGETMTFRLGAGEGVSVSLGRVRAVAFDGTIALARRREVLVWGAFADRDQEYARTVEAAKKHLEGFTFHESFSETFDAPFRQRLLRSRAWLIPEMEAWKGGAGKEQARALKPIVDLYLRRGGRVVICGVMKGHTELLRRAGLIDVSQAEGTADGQPVQPTALGRPFFRGVEGGFVAKNATHLLVAGPALGATEVYAECGRGAVILGRRAGRGIVFALGSDFYDRTPQVEKVLANLLAPHR